jgi:gephyrin
MGETAASGPRTPSAAFKMISIPEALEIVLSETQLLPAQRLPFQDAFRHTLAEDVHAAEPVPAYRASIKDGYAVRATDGPGEYHVAFEAHAGTKPEVLSENAVAYVSTGGPIPEGADAVVQIEDTERLGDGNAVRILRQVEPGEDIRAVGSDMEQGEIALHSGQIVGAAEVGILATVGAVKVQVRRKPVVAVLSTGDEVEEPSAPTLGEGKIRDANRAMLLAAASGVGATVVDLGIARDSVERVEAALDAAIEAGADALLTTGGVSMGDKDFIKPLLERRGTIFFGKVCMKPGKPLTFARVPAGSHSDGSSRSLLVFGLPGNPASSLVTFHLVVVPCLRKMEGWQDPSLRRVHVRTLMDIKMDPQRPEYHRAVVRWARREGSGELEGEFVAESTGGQISSRILSLRSANALLEVPRAKGVLPAGSLVSALLLGGTEAMPQITEHSMLKIAAP